ncbi:hypothetical protein HZH66_014847 [Vespula vulgaris]|uniref:Uncharacterized protein n=1 Tax=Vespula vulgaris TaxID=7454 RepID=A0A834IZ43_VESVU|nr:hypothetical protein HZH66_014847 [Vespula vulgaris]
MADDEKGSGGGGGCRWTKREKEEMQGVTIRGCAASTEETGRSMKRVMAWWYGSGGILLLPRRGLTNAKPPFEIHPSETSAFVRAIADADDGIGVGDVGGVGVDGVGCVVVVVLAVASNG